MARPATNPSVRLTRIEAAAKKVAGLRPRETMTAAPMAALLGVTWPTLRDWCDTLPGFASSGAFTPGGNGVEYSFKPKRTVAWLGKHYRGVIERQSAESKRLTDRIGVRLPAAESPTLAETKDLVNLTVTVVAAAERQGEYVRASEVAAFIEGYNETVVNGILGVRTRADPNGKLPVAVRRQVDEYLRSVAANAHARAKAYIEETQVARLRQGRTR